MSMIGTGSAQGTGQPFEQRGNKMIDNGLKTMITSNKRLQVKRTVVSVQIDELVKKDTYFKAEVRNCLDLFLGNYWGSVVQIDVKRNQEALRTGKDRILGKYYTKRGYIYIIADADRNNAKVIFAKEATTEDLM